MPIKEIKCAIRELYWAIKTKDKAQGWSLFHYWIWRVNYYLK